jgi:hypothetical protein
MGCRGWVVWLAWVVSLGLGQELGVRVLGRVVEVFIGGAVPFLMGIVWAGVYDSNDVHVVAPLVVGDEEEGAEVV